MAVKLIFLCGTLRWYNAFFSGISAGGKCKHAHLTVDTSVYDQRRDNIKTLYERVQTEKSIYTIPPQVELLAINADGPTDST